MYTLPTAAVEPVEAGLPSFSFWITPVLVLVCIAILWVLSSASISASHHEETSVFLERSPSRSTSIGLLTRTTRLSSEALSWSCGEYADVHSV